MSRRAARILSSIETYTNMEGFIPDDEKKEEFKQLINSLRERFFYGDEFNIDFRITIKFIEKYLDQEDFIELLSKFENFDLILHPFHEEDYYPLEYFVEPMIYVLTSKSSEIKAKATEGLMKIICFFLQQLESVQYIETIETLIGFFHKIQKVNAFPVIQKIIDIASNEQLLKNKITKFLNELSDFKQRLYGKELGMDDVKEFCSKLIARLK